MTNIAQLRDQFWRLRSVEERLLLCCARQHLDAGWQARILEVCDAERLSWQRVLATAIAHQVSPLVFHNLGQCHDVVAKMPEATRNAFHMEMVGNLSAKEAMADALHKALGYFEEQGIDVMLVKGTSLDHRVYQQPWYTISGDIDLLLRPNQDPSQGIDPHVWSRLVEMNAGRPAIDVHQGRHPDLVMNGVLSVDFGRIWAEAEQITVRGRRAYLMTAEDELVCACINSCRKRYFRLKSLCEIAELIRLHPNLSFDGVAERAAAYGCRGIVYTALLAAAIAVGCALPDDLQQSLGVSRPKNSLLRFLLVRMSFSSLPKLYASRRLLGKNLGRSLVLPYASLGWWRALRSVWVAGSQMAKA
jgi:hypothetical protein